MSTWPLVDAKDDGIRPAGKPDECFYCNQKVSNPHGRDCVVVTKLIEMRVIAALPDGTEHRGLWQFREPFAWDAEMSEFHKNDSSWCAGNLLNQRDAGSVIWEGPAPWDALAALSEDRCLCNVLRFEFVRVVDKAPYRQLKNVEQSWTDAEAWIRQNSIKLP